MKKKLLIYSFLLSALVVQAKDITIVVRGITPTSGDNTEVITLGLTDTLEVTPAVNATTIYVSLMDMQGTIYQQHCVPATCNDLLSVISPILPNGFMLEIRDDRGCIYRIPGE